MPDKDDNAEKGGEEAQEEGSDTRYDFKVIEPKWADYWEEEEVYRFDPNGERPYTIDNPPRYASGGLHLGHAVHYTHIDFAARYKRLRGFNVMFPLCFDVNGMPIEVNVEKKYDIKMRDTPRQEFVKLCEDFANANIGEMKRQFKILGESMDPSVYYQTDAKYYRRLTQVSFLRLFKKGLIYQGEFPVNWCPRCSTALAESEVEYGNRTTKLNYVKFKVKETGQELIIATTRPELLCTCQLVAVNPDDERASELRGKTAVTPIYEREVMIVEDDKVEPEFGTGIVMICTIGDKEDLNWVYEYGLDLEKGIDKDGNMTERAGPYQGMPLSEARAAIIRDMDEKGLLIKQEDLEQNVGMCWRCSAPIEFLQVPQWFLKTLDFRAEVLNRADEIQWFPKFMKQRLYDWVNSLGWDWVISRQRYFATPIPLWECKECGEVVLPAEGDCYVDPTIDKPPVEKCPECGGELEGCRDVFDTWMDSSISALYNSFWLRDDKLFEKLFPMSLRPQSHDIIRTWAFYTILRAHLLEDKKPWDNVMIGGFILAEDGSPMHASKGNAVDPLQFLEENGADALRYYATQCAIGEDNAFRWKDVVRGNRFLQKFWNVSRLIGREVSDLAGQPQEGELEDVDRWILSGYTKVVEKATEHMDNFRFDQAIKLVEGFMWHTLADHYLEMIKHRMGRGDQGLRYTLYTVGLGVVKMLSPFLPHITEEIYHRYYAADGKKSVHISSWPKAVMCDEKAEGIGETVKDVVAAIRGWKSSKGIPLSQAIKYAGIVADEDKGAAIESNMETIKNTMKIETCALEEMESAEHYPSAVEPVPAAIGPKWRGESQAIIEAVKALNEDRGKVEKAASAIESEGKFAMEVRGKEVELGPEEVDIKRGIRMKGHDVDCIEAGENTLILLER